MNYIRTVNGQKFFFENPGDYHYSIEEIARGLSRVARYNGHTDGQVYNVAQHSLLVSYLVPELYALQALLHDASEFVTGDITKPLKNLIDTHSNDFFSDLEEDIQRAMHKQLAVPRRKAGHRWIKRADAAALRFEQWCLQLENPESYYPFPPNAHTLSWIPGVHPAMRCYGETINYTVVPHDAETSERLFLQRWTELQEQACQRILSSNASAELCTLLGVKP